MSQESRDDMTLVVAMVSSCRLCSGSEMAQRRRLRSAAGHQLVVPSYRLNSCGLTMELFA